VDLPKGGPKKRITVTPLYLLSFTNELQPSWISASFQRWFRDNFSLFQRRVQIAKDYTKYREIKLPLLGVAADGWGGREQKKRYSSEKKKTEPDSCMNESIL